MEITRKFKNNLAWFNLVLLVKAEKWSLEKRFTGEKEGKTVLTEVKQQQLAYS